MRLSSSSSWVISLCVALVAAVPAPSPTAKPDQIEPPTKVRAARTAPSLDLASGIVQPVIPSLNLNLANINAPNEPDQEEPSTPTGQSVPPYDVNQPLRRIPLGAIECYGPKPWFNYPPPWSYRSFSNLQSLCAAREHRGNRDGNMGGYCDEAENVVKFSQDDANYDLYNDEALKLWCFARCRCLRSARATGVAHRRPDTPIPISDGVHLNTANWGLTLLYGPDPQHPQSVQVLVPQPPDNPYAIPIPAVWQSWLDAASASAATAIATETRSILVTETATAGTGPSTPSPTPDVGPPGSDTSEETGSNFGDDEPAITDEEQLAGGPDGSEGDDAGSTCSSNSACPGTQVCDVSVKQYKPGSDPVFWPGICVALIVSTSGLFGRDMTGNSSIDYIANLTSGNSSLSLAANGTWVSRGEHPKLRNGTAAHCACNSSFVADPCCYVHDGNVPASVRKLGKIEYESA